MFDRLKKAIGKSLVRYLETPSAHYRPIFAPDPARLSRCLQMGDVLLIDGNTRLSAAIKYLTQSTWSHAVLYVGEGFEDVLGVSPSGEPNVVIEALAEHGVVASPLSKYAAFNNRICRPFALSDAQKKMVVEYCLKHLGLQYDIRHALDLARYLVPFPPVPVAVRRRMLAFGSSEPTRAICSTLIASAFHFVHYPILPANELDSDLDMDGEPDMGAGYLMSAQMKKEIIHIRNVGLFAPRDFDISPYFDIIKPTIEEGVAGVWRWQEEDQVHEW